MRKLDTWPETIGRGVFIGSVVGALCISGLFLVLMCVEAVFDPSPVSVVDEVLSGAFVLLVSFLYAFFVWLAGILLFGLAPWWLLHRLRLRGKLAAAGLGFAMPTLLLALPSRGNYILAGCALGAVGVLVAEAIWYSSYKYGAGANEVAAPVQNISGE